MSLLTTMVPLNAAVSATVAMCSISWMCILITSLVIAARLGSDKPKAADCVFSSRSFTKGNSVTPPSFLRSG